MFHAEVLESPLLRGAFLAGWAARSLALLRAGRGETDPEWRRYDRGATVLALGLLAFDLGWPGGWEFLQPGEIGGVLAGSLLGSALGMKRMSRSGAEEDRDPA